MRWNFMKDHYIKSKISDKIIIKQKQKSKKQKLNHMEVIRSAPAAARQENKNESVAHGIQKARQTYLTNLIENATHKKEELSREADADIDSN